MSLLVPLPATQVVTDLFINAMLKCGGLIRAVCFERETGVYLCLKKKYTKILNDDVWGGGTSSWSEGGSFGSPSPVSSNTGGDTRVLSGDVKKPNTEVGWGKDLILLQNLLTSRNSHNSLSICCCSLLVRVIVFRHPGVSLGKAKPFSRHWNYHGPHLILEAQVLQLYEGHSEFQQDSRACNRPKASSASYVRICSHGVIYCVFQQAT